MHLPHPVSAPAARRGRTFVALAPLAFAGAAAAQPYSIDWYTIDGGGSTFAVGGAFSLGATAGQPDAGACSGGSFSITGGFWPLPAAAVPCYANCDGSTNSPVLNVNDFICFQSRFAAAEPYADCDQSGTLNVNDFICFQGRFAAGCP